MNICIGCGKEFKPHKNHPNQKYCSRLCHNCNMSVSAYGYSPYEEGQGDRFMKIEKRSKQ